MILYYMIVRWLFSSSAKDIGYLYLISPCSPELVPDQMLIRAELAVQSSIGWELYNMMAHALL
jgi:heme/copper-type cytochrome/quinol oxidase subunit 1